ncbi:MAG TPA: hypothetical protein VGP47_02265 [Parachlamydiaceae bacterium]|nr:hypothetical protein [Parachlamydiaceae bacterium]
MSIFDAYEHLDKVRSFCRRLDRDNTGLCIKKVFAFSQENFDRIVSLSPSEANGLGYTVKFYCSDIAPTFNGHGERATCPRDMLTGTGQNLLMRLLK